MAKTGDGPTTLSDVDIDDADRARIQYLTRDGSGLTEAEAERIVRFAHLPRQYRDPSALRIDGNSTGDSDASGGSSTAGPNGSDPDTEATCAAMRRAMRDATRVADVVEQYPDKHPSAIFRHAEGRCACDVDVDPTTSPRVGRVECLDMRQAFRQGATKRDIMADFYRSANAVNKHLFGRCDHDFADRGTTELTATECGHLREAYRRTASVSVSDLSAACLISKSTVFKHLRGRCSHDVDVPPVDGNELSARDCASMRRAYRDDDNPVVAAIARDHATTRPTADYHIFGRCDHDVGEPPARRR